MALPRVSSRPVASADSRKPARRRGQSLVEFAILLPLLLAFLGLTIDFARVFQAWITLESATRDAAEAAATSATSNGDALTLGQRTICLQAQNVPGFVPSSSPSPADVEQCTSPNVTVVSFDVSATAPGASDRYPIGSATIESRLEFRPLFAYPIITQDGAWMIITRSSFSIVQGRE
jgi:Flp pilus assembly protein TadG